MSLNVPVEEIMSGLKTLATNLQNRGLRLVLTATEAALGTAPELSSLLAALQQAELYQELSKAALETLTIILYQGPISKTQIDYVRGVNSQFILRHLLMKGLIERVAHATDARSFLYQTTPQLLAHLGITIQEELPEYKLVRDRLQDI